jgi:DNA-binding transcriptional MerR regulator
MRGKKEDWDDELLARAAGLKRAGFTLKQIAEKLDKPEGSVKLRLSRIGAKRRLNGNGGRGPKPIGRIGLEMIETTYDTIDLLGTSEERKTYDGTD